MLLAKLSTVPSGSSRVPAGLVIYSLNQLDGPRDNAAGKARLLYGQCSVHSGNKLLANLIIKLHPL